MDDMSFAKGQRVIYTDRDGNFHGGVVESQRKGWVMVALDRPLYTDQGWNASKMMLKSSRITVEGGVGDGDG